MQISEPVYDSTGRVIAVNIMDSSDPRVKFIAGTRVLPRTVWDRVVELIKRWLKRRK